MCVCVASSSEVVTVGNSCYVVSLSACLSARVFLLILSTVWAIEVVVYVLVIRISWCAGVGSWRWLPGVVLVRCSVAGPPLVVKPIII